MVGATSAPDGRSPTVLGRDSLCPGFSTVPGDDQQAHSGSSQHCRSLCHSLHGKHGEEEPPHFLCEAAAAGKAGWFTQGHVAWQWGQGSIESSPLPPPALHSPPSPAHLSSPWAGWEQTWCHRRTCSCPCWSRHPPHKPGTPGGGSIRDLEAQPPPPQGGSFQRC